MTQEAGRFNPPCSTRTIDGRTAEVGSCDTRFGSGIEILPSSASSCRRVLFSLISAVRPRTTSGSWLPLPDRPLTHRARKRGRSGVQALATHAHVGP
jgi:hypothetical protein